jgi:Xaa-Pro aminopeptidase
LTEATRTARADRVLDLFGERELDALLVTNPANVRYLTGFTGTNGIAVVTRDERVFVTDFRYVEQAAEQVRGFEPVKGERDLVGDVAARLSGRAGFDDAHMSVRAHRKLSEAVGEGVELIAAGGLVERLREVKDEDELRAIVAAAELANGVLEDVLARGLVGRTEKAVAREIERELLDRGADEPSFPPIVAAGAHGALPHAEPREVEIQPNTLVMIDMGARVDGYCSDCTRTVATGELDDPAVAVYELVLRAQQAALAAVRPGAAAAGVDAVARELIEAGGHGERFGHGLGHGVGLEVHEGPRLAKTAEGSLVPGNVVTVEPGVYVPGEVGVRIEDLVVVTEDGGRSLSAFPKELVTVG